jgi:hypothetical protein
VARKITIYFYIPNTLLWTRREAGKGISGYYFGADTFMANWQPFPANLALMLGQSAVGLQDRETWHCPSSIANATMWRSPWLQMDLDTCRG